jgi:hypothetical protein
VAGETTDDDLVEAWRKIIDEKVKLSEKMGAMAQSLSKSEEIAKDTLKNVNSFKSVLTSVEVSKV